MKYESYIEVTFKEKGVPPQKWVALLNFYKQLAY